MFETKIFRLSPSFSWYYQLVSAYIRFKQVETTVKSRVKVPVESNETIIVRKVNGFIQLTKILKVLVAHGDIGVNVVEKKLLSYVRF